jgi:hypothetical protein
MTRKLSPALLARIDRLSGCQGRWIVDCRELEGNYSYALRDLRECWPLYTPDGERYYDEGEVCRATGYRVGSPESAALYCAHTGWKSRLLFVSDYLREDRSWPGGYSPSAVYRSNARVFRDEFRRELEKADGDGPDVALDVRYVTDEMLETLEGLESYPLISEDDHSELEVEDQQEAWENWAASDWRRLVCAAIDQFLPDGAQKDGDEILDAMPDADSKLAELFRDCCEWSNTYWEEDGDAGQWIDLDRVAKQLGIHEIRDFTGLQLLDPDQKWRTEPYPWPGAPASPLLVAEQI